MVTDPRMASASAVETRPLPQAGEPAPSAMGYLLDAESESVVRQSFSDAGLIDGHVAHGGVNTAVEELAQRRWPHFLVVDISGLADPMPSINQLAEICDPATEVLVVGERNDVALYRELKAAGAAEYFFKPLLGNLLTRTLIGINSGTRSLEPSRSGKLVLVIGVRGGVGATTIATNLAWYFAEVRQRGTLLLDLDLHGGDAALQLDAQPGRALREALDDPKRIDELFLERGVVPVGSRLGLLAGLASLSDRLALSETAIMLLLEKLLARYRYVLVDLPSESALSLSVLLHMPATVLLVSDGSLSSTREVGRWREFLGNASAERPLIHLLNKKNADGSLSEEDRTRVIPPPEVTIRWDRDIMRASALGTKEVFECSAIRDGMAALSLQVSGVSADSGRSLWQRIFG